MRILSAGHRRKIHTFGWRELNTVPPFLNIFFTSSITVCLGLQRSRLKVLPLIVSSLGSQDGCPATFQLSGKPVPWLINSHRGRAGMEHYEPIRTLAKKKKKSRISYAIVKYVASFLPVMGQPSLTIIM